MKSGRDSIGPRGLALLGLVGAAGIVLGLHGWSHRLALTSVGPVGSVPAAVHHPPATHSPAAAAAASAGPPASAARTQPAAGPSAPAPGPLLSAQSYAQYAVQVWPGNVTQAARLAETGLTIAVRRNGPQLEVSASVTGQPVAAPHAYPSGARVYVIEAALGDDSGSSDYNLGDDGLVVTDALGRIVT